MEALSEGMSSSDDGGEAREWVRRTGHTAGQTDSIGPFFFFLMQKEVENTWLRTAIGGEWECFLGKGSFFCGCKYIGNQYKFSKSRNTKHANKKGTLAFKGSIKCARHN